MFGFSCKDPLAVIGLVTRKGDLCTNFLACLTCPNAIITHDARTSAVCYKHTITCVPRVPIASARWQRSTRSATHSRGRYSDALSRAEVADAQRLRTGLPAISPHSDEAHHPTRAITAVHQTRDRSGLVPERFKWSDACWRFAPPAPRGRAPYHILWDSR